MYFIFVGILESLRGKYTKGGLSSSASSDFLMMEMWLMITVGKYMERAPKSH